jgi:hypothetical protein
MIWSTQIWNLHNAQFTAGKLFYPQILHINSTTTRCIGVPKLCSYARPNTFYRSSKFGTPMTNGSPPAEFSIYKFQIPIAQQSQWVGMPKLCRYATLDIFYHTFNFGMVLVLFW